MCAFAAVKNDAQFMFSTVHDVVLHVQRPLQMADFGGQQSGIAAGSAQQFGIIAHDIQVMGYQRHDGDKENTVEKKKGVQFFLTAISFQDMTGILMHHRRVKQTRLFFEMWG